MLLLAARTLLDDKLVAALGTHGTGLARTFDLGEPAPGRTRVLVRLGLATTTTVRMVHSIHESVRIQSKIQYE